MPTTYTAVATATQAPATAPLVRLPVQIVIPNDGESDNVASITQALKVLADYSAFEQSPFAYAAHYDTLVKKFSNAKVHGGSFFDHQGVIGGELLEWFENWQQGSAFSFAAPAASNYQGWKYLARGSGAGFAAFGTYSGVGTAPRGPVVIAAPGTGPTTACLEREFHLFVMGEDWASYGFNFTINGASAPDASSSFALGLSDGSLAGNVSDVAFNTGGGPSPAGVAIYSNGTTGAGWATYAKPTGGSVNTTTLTPTLARDINMRVRFDISGTGSDDSSAAKVQTWINGTLESTVLVDMNNTPLRPFIRATATSGNVCSVVGGRLWFKARLASGDVTI